MTESGCNSQIVFTDAFAEWPRQMKRIGGRGMGKRAEILTGEKEGEAGTDFWR